MLNKKCISILMSGSSKPLGSECGVPSTSDFCSACVNKPCYQFQRIPVFRHIIKEWRCFPMENDRILVTNYGFILKCDTQVHLVKVCANPNMLTDNSDFREPTQNEIQIVRDMGIIVDEEVIRQNLIKPELDTSPETIEHIIRWIDDTIREEILYAYTDLFPDHVLSSIEYSRLAKCVLEKYIEKC